MLTVSISDSKEASTYDSKHERGLGQILDHIRGRLDFIGVDWVDDDDDDAEDDPDKSVRLLDYACGTGNVSRVRDFLTAQPVAPSPRLPWRRSDLMLRP
jgi:hypothetical protein